MVDTFRPPLKQFLKVLALGLAILLTSQSAGLSSISINDSGATTAQYEKFHVISATYDFTLTASNGIYTPGQSPNYIHVGGASHLVNFTHASLSAVTNANQNFSLASGTNNCAANLNAIASDHVEITSVTSGCTVDFSYRMPSAFASLSIPQTVIYTFGSASQLIQQAQYFTSASSFASCATPCVFQNSANRTLIVKTPTSGASTLDFYFPANTAGGTPVVTPSSGNTGGGPPISFPIPPVVGNTTSIVTNNAGTVQIAVIIVVVVLMVALVLGRLREEKPFRKPKRSEPAPYLKRS